jgi:hypothetical protein
MRVSPVDRFGLETPHASDSNALSAGRRVAVPITFLSITFIVTWNIEKHLGDGMPI